ncbi:hypothetical protein J0K78_03000 [Halobacillus sp. GSS1]|uniref:hypothetical protein n=1 Tax=Halobacillus sp. GSS1 TaxID=2815919 RepID=UPI001A8FA2BF|nr:hypothetical protein [Halobacillus sp. GSS1]MBN9653220.1 hypothetical protein [Halobacillus sp. GSS1]
MKKTWRWIGHILFGAAVLIFLWMLLTDQPTIPNRMGVDFPGAISCHYKGDGHA